MRKNSNIFGDCIMARWGKWLGITFTVFGTIFLLENLNVFLLNWSLYILLSGVALILVFFLNRELAVFLLPGVTLLIYGILFFYCQITGWEHLARWWPLLLIAPGLSFAILYGVRPQAKHYLYSASILTGFGLLFFLRKVEYIKFWPVILIVAGLILLVRFYSSADHS